MVNAKSLIEFAQCFFITQATPKPTARCEQTAAYRDTTWWSHIIHWLHVQGCMIGYCNGLSRIQLVTIS
jgi:hypothetical protein